MTTEEHIEYATILLDRIGDITADEIVEPVVTWWRSLSDLCMLSEVAVELFGPVPDLEQAFLVRLTELSAVIDRAADLIATYSSDWVGHGVSGTPEIGLAARSPLRSVHRRAGTSQPADPPRGDRARVSGALT